MNIRIQKPWKQAVFLFCLFGTKGCYLTVDPRGAGEPSDKVMDTETSVEPSTPDWDRFPQVCSIDGWCGAGATFSAVWGSGADDIWVVANDIYRENLGTTSFALIHRDGYRWSDEAWMKTQWAYGSPVSASGAAVSSLWGSGPSDVWAVGKGGILIHFDGNSWTDYSGVTAADLAAVWGSSSSDVWAVGAEGTILRFDGATWTEFSGVTEADLKSISGSGADDVWAVGGGMVINWNGLSWSTVTSPAFSNMNAVWVKGQGDLFAVGYRGSIYHYNGADWSSYSVDTNIDFNAVFGSGNEAWAAGTVNGSAGTLGVLYSWNGADWSQKAIDIASPLRAGRRAPDGTMWAVGDRGTSVVCTEETCSVHPKTDASDFKAIWGNRRDSVFAVGAGGAIAHFDGEDWSDAPRVTDANLSSVWGSAQDDVWAVGDEGAMVHFDGRSWSSQSSGTDVSLASIWGSGLNDIWSVGDNGTLLHFDGGMWTRWESGTDADLFGVFGFASDDVWVVGADQTSIHFDGAAWSLPEPYNGDGSVNLTLVFGNRADDYWITGSYSYSYYRGGSGGPILAHDRGDASTGCSVFQVTSAWVENENAIWATAGAPNLVYWNGSRWVQSFSGLNGITLEAVWGASEHDVWLVGDQGTILRNRSMPRDFVDSPYRQRFDCELSSGD